MIESSVAGIQTLKDRDAGFRRGLAAGCPQVKVASPRFNNNDINTAASQVNDVVTANPNLIGIFADNNTSGTGAARAIKDNKAAQRLPVVAFDTDPQENAALKDGSIDALVVQNPYFFGYQGVVEAGMAAVKTLPPLNLDPGAVVADKANMDHARGQAAAEPADREGAGLMGATVTERDARGPDADPGRLAAERREGLRADPGARRRHVRAARRRGHVPRRRERRRQEHADQDPHRRDQARQRRVPDRRRGRRQSVAGRRRARPASASSTRSSACCRTCRSARTC